MSLALSRLLTFVAILLLGMVLRAIDAPPNFGAFAAALAGFTLLAAFAAGSLAAQARLPRLTGYVLTGVLVGPFALAILSPDMVGALGTVDELALALIALTAGGELKIAQVRRYLRAIVAVSIGVMGVVSLGIAALVIAARPLVPFLADQPIGVTIAVAALLGVWCANSSPDATIAVINESRAQGELTDSILGVTIFKDVLVIMTFAAVLAFARPLVSVDTAFDLALLGDVAWEVLGALLVGGLAGVGFAWYLERIGARTVLATLVFTFLLTLIARELHVELLLTAVAAGFAIENFSEAGDRLIDAVESNAVVVFALFFAIAGATLDLRALATYWPMALVLVAARAGLTWVGARIGVRLGRPSPSVGPRIWMGLISQAGVTLGLSLLVGAQLPAIGDRFVAVTAAVIIFHLLLGPVLLKHALVTAGEAGLEGQEGRSPAEALKAAAGGGR